jgi:hypothetical protein
MGASGYNLWVDNLSTGASQKTIFVSEFRIKANAAEISYTAT